MDEGLHPRLEHSDWAVDFLEPPCHLKLERCNFMVPSNRGRDAGKHITGREPHCEPVRVLYDAGILDAQTKL